MVVQRVLPRRSNPKIQSRKFTRIHWGSYLYGFVDWRLCRNKFAVLYIQSQGVISKGFHASPQLKLLGCLFEGGLKRAVRARTSSKWGGPQSHCSAPPS